MRRLLSDENKSFIQTLIKFQRENPEEKIDNTFIRDNIVTVMFAGYETTAMTFSYIAEMLALYPDWQVKLKREIAAFNEDFSYQSLGNTPVLEAIINETMRMYPAGWGFTRNAVDDDEALGVHIKSDEIVLISPFLTGRNPVCHTDAESFDPNRFLNNTINRDAYIPFGMGARTCSGANFRHFRIESYFNDDFKKSSFKRAGEKCQVDEGHSLFKKMVLI